VESPRKKNKRKGKDHDSNYKGIRDGTKGEKWPEEKIGDGRSAPATDLLGQLKPRRKTERVAKSPGKGKLWESHVLPTHTTIKKWREEREKKKDGQTSAKKKH